LPPWIGHNELEILEFIKIVDAKTAGLTVEKSDITSLIDDVKDVSRKANSQRLAKNDASRSVTALG
jgi:hypothetical protein